MRREARVLHVPHGGSKRTQRTNSMEAMRHRAFVHASSHEPRRRIPAGWRRRRADDKYDTRHARAAEQQRKQNLSLRGLTVRRHMRARTRRQPTGEAKTGESYSCRAAFRLKKTELSRHESASN